MPLLGLLWQLTRRRRVRRILRWLIVRLIRRFGWRRAVRLLVGGRRRWRPAALGLWRAARRVLRLGRSAVLRLSRPRARTARPLGLRQSPRTGAPWRSLTAALDVVYRRWRSHPAVAGAVRGRHRLGLALGDRAPR